MLLLLAKQLVSTRKLIFAILFMASGIVAIISTTAPSFQTTVNASQTYLGNDLLFHSPIQIFENMGGINQLVGQLQIETNNISIAGDYKVLVMASDKPHLDEADNATTYGWLGIDLAQGSGVGGLEFTQVGLLTDKTGVRWFVYAESGVTCLEGDPSFGTCNGYSCGCEGDNYQWVTLYGWHWMELVTYGQGFWIARVYEPNGTAHDVAQIWSTSQQIYYAQSTTEEAYSTPSDPFITASFYYCYPQVSIPGQGFQNWPQSVGGPASSNIHVTNQNGHNVACPQHYGADPNLWGEEYAWFAGTGGQVCSWLLFPSEHTHLPLVLKNYP